MVNLLARIAVCKVAFSENRGGLMTAERKHVGVLERLRPVRYACVVFSQPAELKSSRFTEVLK